MPIALVGTVHAQPIPVPDPQAPAAAQPLATSKIRIHIVSTQHTYVAMRFDVFSVATKRIAASSTGAIESRGEQAPVLELAPGLYKIVRAGEPFEAQVDFAVIAVTEPVADFVIVVDPDTFEFRGSGPLVGELPRGVSIGDFTLSLNAGGNMLFDQKRSVVGKTSGTAALIGLFGNFGLVIDKRPHFVDVDAAVQLDLVDPVTGSISPTRDRFEAAGLYSYKLNRYVGPYVRAGMRTRVFPGYLYLSRERGAGMVTINRLDGRNEVRLFGTGASPDDLRIRIASPFAPLRLQEEVGANFAAADLRLCLLTLAIKLAISTRVGFGFRQGITNGLLVVDGSEQADPLVLREVDDYSTLGPVVGANASITLARWLFGTAQLGVLAPLMNADKSASARTAGRLLIELSGTAGFRVPLATKRVFASADYTFALERDAFLTARTQFEHAILARVSVALF